MRTHLLSVLGTLVVVLPAQSPPCLSLNDVTNSVVTTITSTPFSGQPPNYRAYQITPVGSVVAQAIRLFTGNVTTITPGFMSLEIWSNDPVTNLPLARLSGGTSRMWKDLGNTWQGSDLDAPTLLIVNTPYWILWIADGGWNVPDEPIGATLPATVPLLTSSNGTTWTVQAPAALKYRIYCSRLDGPGLTVNGTPCATSKLKLGGLFANEPPKVGNAFFTLEASGFPSAATAALLIGVQPNWVSIPNPLLQAGCLIHTDIVLTLPGTTGTGNVRAVATTVGAAGHVSFPLAIPANPSLVGGYLGTQVAVVDAGLTSALPLALTNGLRVKIY